jgi:hypothetical protein
MNQLPQSDNANRLDHNELSGLRIPLGKEVQQIALAFASEQTNAVKGKQVFLNTLSVIAVHKCLKWFGFESDFGDCWNKTRRAIFNVADLLVQDWGRIECFPILPEQTSIDLSDVPPDLIETRQGFVGIKFHQYFNFVEMSGFIHLKKLDKSILEKTVTLNIQELEPFENVFNHLPSLLPDIKKIKIPLINIADFSNYRIPLSSLDDWKTKEEIQSELDLAEKKQLITVSSTKNNSKTHLFKQINFQDEDNDLRYQILLSVTITTKNHDSRKVMVEFFELNGQNLPDTLIFDYRDTEQNSGAITFNSNKFFNKSFNNQKAGELFQFCLKFKDEITGAKFVL